MDFSTGHDIFNRLPCDYPRRYLPGNLDAGVFENLRSYLDSLLNAEIRNKEEFDEWMAKISELKAAVYEVYTRRRILATIDASDNDRRLKQNETLDTLIAPFENITDRLTEKMLNPTVAGFAKGGPYAFYLDIRRKNTGPVSPENNRLDLELIQRMQVYDRTVGSVTIPFDGSEQTFQMLVRYSELPDRRLRESAFRAQWDRRVAIAPELDTLFDEMFDMRLRMARNAGIRNVTEYQFRALGRNEYGPVDCLRLHDAVEQVVLPAVQRLYDRRRRALGLETLKPWDLHSDPKGRPPLKPFSDIDSLVKGCSRIFHRIDNELGRQFDRIRQLGLMDLENRPGKTPGASSKTLPESRLPFIIMNATGTFEDLILLLHESGHALHTMARGKQGFYNYRYSPLEFDETISYSMELLGSLFFDEIFSGRDLERARREILQYALTRLMLHTMGDAFQHEIYAHADHIPSGRGDTWVRAAARFEPYVDWSGLESYNRVRWQAQRNFFFAPFYFIEYVMARIAAFQIMRTARKDLTSTVNGLRAAMTLGGSRPLPELFRTAGIPFDFSAQVIHPLIDTLEASIA
ncbi:M3 family oligoendopeptidase [bacterium]|nr:M3 family oligoendopeptidase [candidate division CSSED10-310 bacterium]